MAATFPAAIKVFTVFHDYTDIIWALSINECHDEIVALEKIVGANPFLGTPFTSVGGAIQYLYNNKAPPTDVQGVPRKGLAPTIISRATISS